MVPDAAQQDPANVGKSHILGNRTNARLRRHQIQHLLQFLDEGVWRLGPILTPPPTSLADLP
jgi:hypothetical protein